MSMPQAETMTGSTGRNLSGVTRVDRDAALVEGLRRGDPAAPEQLLDTYGDRVYRLAIRITGNEQDAEEVVQDALWTAARKIDMFKGESAFGSWVYRITANTAYQKLRVRQGRGAGTAGRAPHGADLRDRRPARRLPDSLPHARRRGPVQSGDRRVAAPEPARGQISRAPLAALPAGAPLALHAGRVRTRA